MLLELQLVIQAIQACFLSPLMAVKTAKVHWVLIHFNSR